MVPRCWRLARFPRLTWAARGVGLAACFLGVGCSSEPSGGSESDVSGTTPEGSSSDVRSGDVSASPPSPTSDGVDVATSEAGDVSCKPGPGTTGSPKTVLDVVALINGLPMPVTLPCFLRSLDRPLQLLATSSVVSAQPAQGQDNPRLFVVNNDISLSVVTAGESKNLLEIGEITAPDRSIKGEISFPVEAPLTLEAPFTRIAQSAERTVCFGCHYPEVPAVGYPAAGAFESTAYRPIPRLEINFDYVEYQFTVCDPSADAERCAMLAALFDQGQVSRGAFPSDMPTFE